MTIWLVVSVKLTEGFFVLEAKLMTYQKTFELLGLSDVNPAVFFNDFDVFYFIVESLKANTIESPKRQAVVCIYN